MWAKYLIRVGHEVWGLMELELYCECLAFLEQFILIKFKPLCLKGEWNMIPPDHQGNCQGWKSVDLISLKHLLDTILLSQAGITGINSDLRNILGVIIVLRDTTIDISIIFSTDLPFSYDNSQQNLRS